jgi:LysR family transcriptional regulator, glycine cleavage system transcriptional activator
MKNRKNIPIAALRAFEAAARHGQLTAAAEELAVTHGAISRHVSHLEDALRIIAKGDDSILDVACLSTFAMRWLIPRLHDFAAKYPHYDVRLATDDRPPRTQIDVSDIRSVARRSDP